MRRDQLPPHKTATFVMLRYKAVYVSVNKAACTSLKWLVADLQGESAERFHTSLSREVSRAMTIHRRQLWRHTPMLHELFWVDNFGHEPWFPRIPRSTDDIVEDWLRFAAAMREQPDHPIMRNRHLAPQKRMLVPDRMPYSRIYETRRIPQLLEDLERHLLAQG